LLGCHHAFGQIDEARWKEWSENLSRNYLDPEITPVAAEKFGDFHGLEFYAYNTEMAVIAEFKRLKKGREFLMATSTDRTPRYRVYGLLTFRIEGKIHTLEVYQNLDLIIKPGYEDYLFLPFNDLTNGNTTYGGGRYLDLRTGAMKKKTTVDFNFAYNPLCAYNHKYSCPIPPEPNDLKAEICAGVKYTSEDKK
jgi:uncharacterized protein